MAKIISIKIGGEIMQDWLVMKVKEIKKVDKETTSGENWRMVFDIGRGNSKFWCLWQICDESR